MLPECMQSTSSCEIKLRELEIDSYSKILSVFRARGNLTNDRRKLLKQIGSFLNISQERHRAEVRRVTNDQLLSSIASRLTGQDWTIDWHEEGKRLPPAPTPFSHFTVNTPFADYIASVASLGKKYLDLYNKQICDSVPNRERTVQGSEASCGNASEKWLGDISQVFSSVQKEKLIDASVQTSKKKVIAKACTYCQRRKEQRKRRLEAAREHSGDSTGTGTAGLPLERLQPADSSTVLLPSGKQIVVENAFTNNTDDLCVSIIAQEVVVETEPSAGPSCRLEEASASRHVSAVSVDAAADTVVASSSVAGPEPTSLQRMVMNVWEESEKPLAPRIPRILNSGPRKRLKKLAPYPALKHPPTGDRGMRRKGPDSYGDGRSPLETTACTLVGSTGTVPVRYPGKPGQVVSTATQPCASSSGRQQSRVKQQNSSAAPLQRHHDGQSKLTSSRSQESSSSVVQQQTGVSRHQEPLSLPPHHQESSRLLETVPKHLDIVLRQHETVSKYHEHTPKQHEAAVSKHREGASKHEPVPKYCRDPPREPLRHHEIISKQTEPSLKPPGGIYKHYVRVRHTPKATRPYQEVCGSQSEQQSTSSLQLNEAVEIPLEFLQSQRPDLFDGGSVQVVEIKDFKMETSHNFVKSQQCRESISLGSLETVLHDHPSAQQLTSSFIGGSGECGESLVEGILLHDSAPTTTGSSSSSPVHGGRSSARREEYPSRKIIKIFNGEKKVHGTIHFRTDQMKDMINRLPSTQFSQVEVNNGCETEDNTASSVVWDGANLTAGEFIMEDVSIIDECSYPLVNGHEEIILHEEVLAGNEMLESLVDKSSEVCVIPSQTDMKFSVVDLSDYTGPIEHIHSVSSQSKDDSRDSDVLINRP